ncbi:MAG: 50S ribosomal protein L4 [Candidatus Colwellbacteria bacterium RBG_13_48_8]|uniref:Large ribosomal subunit protein uL4 n=1 Tax=Candidatus Colwellbacteria bacterium RBG_13_48_8 TaxID=1797685 RepID=A0A1G1YWB6_9BACT|nr:MAG: 50S ribosomal protein L4 [Candidatus Colwellbacteria bacterium RBG_13_48_8]
MKVDLYDQTGDKAGEIEIPDRVFKVAWNPDLVYQALRVQMTNRRQNLAHAKDRGEVRGGGRKPWRQKGTGRARHGSIRSPIWVGGGVTHGPTKDKKYSLRMNKKMRQKATFSVLSRKLADGELRVVEHIDLEQPKTKSLSALLKHYTPKLNALVVVENRNKNVFQSGRNLSKVNIIDPKSLNVYDLLQHEMIILEKEAVVAINEHYHALK